MSRYTITPWRTQADLLEVRQQLYRLEPNTPDTRRNAVARVMAWKLRGNLPHAVESTALLIDAILHHHQDLSNNSPMANSTFSVRAVYSAAFTRFVTGFCDIGRNKERSLEPSSMLEIARQIDMPADFVALRHEATHEELPALRRLVHATEEALGWLWNAYWSRIGEMRVEGRDQGVDLPGIEAEARKILRGFRSARRDAIRTGRHRSPEQDLLAAETAKTCVKLCNGNSETTDALIGVLVDDKLLSPSKRGLGTSLEGAYMLWDGLLQCMWSEQPSTLAALARSLLYAVGVGVTAQSDVDAQREAFCLWLKHFVDDGAWRTFLSSSELLRLRTDMMMWCCTYPGHWSQFLGSKLIETGGPEFVDDWKTIFQASCLKVLDEDEGKERDLDETDLCSGSSKADSRDDHDLNGWTRAVLPMHIPIGVVR